MQPAPLLGAAAFGLTRCRGAKKSHLLFKMVSFQIGNQKGLTFTFVRLDGLRAWNLGPRSWGQSPSDAGVIIRAKASRFVRLNPWGGAMTDISLGPSARPIRPGRRAITGSIVLKRFPAPRFEGRPAIAFAGMRGQLRLAQARREFPSGLVDFLLGRGPRHF